MAAGGQHLPEVDADTHDGRVGTLGETGFWDLGQPPQLPKIFFRLLLLFLVPPFLFSVLALVWTMLVPTEECFFSVLVVPPRDDIVPLDLLQLAVVSAVCWAKIA